MANRRIKCPTKITFRYVGYSKEGEARVVAAFDLIFRRALEFREQDRLKEEIKKSQPIKQQ